MQRQTQVLTAPLRRRLLAPQASALVRRYAHASPGPVASTSSSTSTPTSADAPPPSTPTPNAPPPNATTPNASTGTGLGLGTPAAPRRAYHVPRNTRGSMPVYTDQINTKYLTLVRNVEGDAHALALELKHTLFAPDSPEARRLRVETRRSRHVVLSNGKWKREVFEWLKARGF